MFEPTRARVQRRLHLVGFVHDLDALVHVALEVAVVVGPVVAALDVLALDLGADDGRRARVG